MNHCHFYYFVAHNHFFLSIFRCSDRTIGTGFDSFTPKCTIQLFFKTYDRTIITACKGFFCFFVQSLSFE